MNFANNLGEYILTSDGVINKVLPSMPGYMVTFPKSNQLFIDIDSDLDYAKFMEIWELLISVTNGAARFAESISKSGVPHKHIVVDLPFDVTELERIAFQAIMGSHNARELFNLVNLTNGDNNPTLFFEKNNEPVQSNT
jgi:hypothetical protein